MRIASVQERIYENTTDCEFAPNADMEWALTGLRIDRKSKKSFVFNRFACLFPHTDTTITYQNNPRVWDILFRVYVKNKYPRTNLYLCEELWLTFSVQADPEAWQHPRQAYVCFSGTHGMTRANTSLEHFLAVPVTLRPTGITIDCQTREVAEFIRDFIDYK